MVSVFDYLNYLDFFRDYSESLPKSGRGFRKLLSEHLICQISSISHVLNGLKSKNNESLKQEMSSQVLSFVDQAIYFSEWFYSAILTRGSTLLKLSIKS